MLSLPKIVGTSSPHIHSYCTLTCGLCWVQLKKLLKQLPAAEDRTEAEQDFFRQLRAEVRAVNQCALPHARLPTTRIAWLDEPACAMSMSICSAGVVALHTCGLLREHLGGPSVCYSCCEAAA